MAGPVSPYAGARMLDVTIEIRCTVDAYGNGSVYIGDELMATFQWDGKNMRHIEPELLVNLVVTLETVLWAVQDA